MTREHEECTQILAVSVLNQVKRHLLDKLTE